VPDGPFTTIKVEEYNILRDTIKHLRSVIQNVRQLLEKEDVKSALNLLKESDP
jgi:hypothetical protein